MSEITDILTNLKGWLDDWRDIEDDCVGLKRQLRIEQKEVLRRAAEEIELLRLENAAKQAIIENYNLDMLMDVFKKELEKQVAITFDAGRKNGMMEAARIADGACNGLIDTPAKEPYVMTVAEAIRKAARDSPNLPVVTL